MSSDPLKEDPDVDELTEDQEQQGGTCAARDGSSVSRFLARAVTKVAIKKHQHRTATPSRCFVRAVRDDDALVRQDRYVMLAAGAAGRRLEFRRYFKWKDQLIGFMIFLGVGALSYGVRKLATGGRRAMTIATAGFEMSAPAGSRLIPAPEDTAERRRQLEEGDLGGVLTRRVDGSFDLYVKKDPRYMMELRGILSELVRRERLAQSGLSVSQLESILASPTLPCDSPILTASAPGEPSA